MSTYGDDLSALLAHRTKPLRLVPRAESLASDYSLGYNSPSDRDHFNTTPRQFSPLPPAPPTLDQEQYSPTISDHSSDIQRMSVLGPKIHKNGQAPWELDDDLPAIGEGSDDATAEGQFIFGRRPKGKAKKKVESSKASSSSNSASSKGRQRSRTIAESISPVNALKGLGLGVLGGSASSSAPHSGPQSRSSRNPTPEIPRSKAAAESFVSCSDDDAYSVSTATITGSGGTSIDHHDVRYASQLPDIRQATRSRSKTVSSVAPLNLSRTSSRTTLSSATHAPSLARRPSPAKSLRESRIGPEDMFRSSVTSEADSPYYSLGTNLHPYSNPALLKVNATDVSAFSSDSSPSPSPMEPSPAHTPGRISPEADQETFLDSPSSNSLSEEPSPDSLHPPALAASPLRKPHRKKAPPPPLTLRPSPSATSLSSAKRYFTKGLTSKSRVNSGADIFDIDPRSREDLPLPQPAFYKQSSANPSASSLRRTPNLSPNATSEPGSATLQRQTSSQSTNTEDLPPGMLTFPGSPAYGLISLEQAQARLRTSSASDVKKKRDKDGISGLVARMRMNSETTESSTVFPVISAPLETLTIPPPSPFAGGLATPASPLTANRPQLRQRKSGFLKLFTSGEKSRSGSVSPNPMPTPTSGESFARDWGHFSPQTPIMMSAQQPSPSPITTLPPLPKLPLTARRMSRGSLPVQAPVDVIEHPVPRVPAKYRPQPASFVGTSSTQSEDSTARKVPASEEGHATLAPPNGVQRRPTPLQQQTNLSPSDESASSPDDVKRAQVLVVTSTTSPVAGGGVQFPTSAPITGMHNKEKDTEPMLRLRHMSTNFLTSLPSDYLLNRHQNANAAEEHTPALSPTTPSFNSMASMSSMYASSESSMSPLPTPNSMHHLSPSPYGRGHTPGISPISEAGDDAGSLQDQLASLRKQMRMQAYESERQVRDLKAEIERLKASSTPLMACNECGSYDVRERPDDVAIARSSMFTDEDGAMTPQGRSVVNRSRAPTGNGTRFGSRLV